MISILSFKLSVIRKSFKEDRNTEKTTIPELMAFQVIHTLIKFNLLGYYCVWSSADTYQPKSWNPLQSLNGATLVLLIWKETRTNEDVLKKNPVKTKRHHTSILIHDRVTVRKQKFQNYECCMQHLSTLWNNYLGKSLSSPYAAIQLHYKNFCSSISFSFCTSLGSSMWYYSKPAYNK